jgi:hypothetical protein
LGFSKKTLSPQKMTRARQKSPLKSPGRAVFFREKTANILARRSAGLELPRILKKPHRVSGRPGFSHTDALEMKIVTMLVDPRDCPAELVRQNGTSFRITFEEQRPRQSAREI